MACGGLSFALDQWSKRRAIDRDPLSHGASGVPPRLQLNTRSRGSSPASLLLIWLVALGCAIALARSGAWFQTDAARLGLAAAFGGAAGNLLDLLRRRAVVDFIDLGWWPSFNLADVAIVGGLVLAFSRA
jgi:signal peptidase II